jgi:hypothetical protein
VSLEGSEHDTAFVRLVTVMEQVTGHAVSLPYSRQPDIGRHPDPAP